MELALIEIGNRELAKPAGNALCHAGAVGALIAVGRFLRDAAAPDAIGRAEQYAVANLRGAMRGAAGPVLDNGNPFTGASDA